jgi:hypothetical protein
MFFNLTLQTEQKVCTRFQKLEENTPVLQGWHHHPCYHPQGQEVSAVPR